MFKSLRWRLTFWYILITTIVYAVLAFFGSWMFKVEMTRVMDEELHALVDELRPAIEIRDTKPNLQRWASTSLKIPFHILPTIQLFDANRRLIEQHGPTGVSSLFLDANEITSEEYHIRVCSVPLLDGRNLVGYLQLQLSLHNRDRSIKQFASTMASLAPFLLLGLGISGYIFSSKAAQPVESSFDVLKRFMSDAGHELGTPLSIIQANAEAMEINLTENSEAAQRLPIIYRSTERMSNLVRDLVLLSKMESPQVMTQRSSLDFGRLTRTVLEEFDELFKAKSVILKSDEIDSCPIIGDGESLKQLVTNLLQNALRYTEPGGEVSVALDIIGRNARLIVQDTGVGIPEESIPRIFQRFYRVEKSRTRTQGGAGLGLSIVKAVVDAHRGRIEVHSQLGVGTTFTVTLPVR